MASYKNNDLPLARNALTKALRMNQKFRGAEEAKKAIEEIASAKIK
jgi:hypothetical protein